MAQIGIGLLGAARITDKAVVYPAHVIPQVKLTAMAARDRARAEATAEVWGVEHVVDDYQAVIDHPDVDIIYNPLPINLHAEWTIEALQAGKHVLCEKPFAMNSDEARAMLAAEEASEGRLIEAFHYRYHPAFQTCMDWIASGAIGAVREIEAVFNVEIKDTGHEIRHMKETGGGAMMDLGCYPLHWALSIMGAAPVDVAATATLTPKGVDETMAATLTFEGGATARLSSSMAAGERFRAELVVKGETGEISFKNPLAPHMGAVLTCTDGRKAVIELISTYTYQLAGIVKALHSGEALPTEGEMVLRQQSALDEVYEAAGLRALRFA